MTTRDDSDSCAICQRQENVDVGGTIVYCDQHWMVRHSQETNILGYFVLESRRHYVDMSEATPEEAAAYGPLLSLLMQSVRQATGCDRVYTFSLGEAVPHYHLHVVPRMSGLPRAFRGRGIMSYPINPPADAALVDQTCQRIRRLLSVSKAVV